MNRVDREDLRLVIDEWKRTYEGGKYMGLLLRSKPDKDGKVKDWLVAMNDNFENGTAENMRHWIKTELEGIGLRIENVTLVVADNESTNKKLAADMGAEFEGCFVHLTDLIGDDAWAVLQGSWPSKVQNMIFSYFASSSTQNTLKSYQKEAGKSVLGLLNWNPTRWLGKPIALIRLLEVCNDRRSKEIIGFNLTPEEIVVMKDTISLMETLASLITSFSLEESKQFPMIALSNYGSHYRVIQQTYVTLVTQMATLDWESHHLTEREILWNFSKKMIDCFQKRFFTTISPEVIIGYALDKGVICNFGFNTFPELEKLFLTEERNGALFLHDAKFKTVISNAHALRILAQAPAPMQDNTPITSSNIISHLKYHFQCFHSKWTDELTSDASILSALQAYLDTHPLPTTDDIAPSSSVPFKDSPTSARNLLQGSPPPNRPNRLSSLIDDWTTFKNWKLPTGYYNSLQWACSGSTTGYTVIRHLITKILPRPYTSVPAEQVFSVGRSQTSSYSSTLNSDDYETRVIIAYNRRNYTFQERASFYDILPYVFDHLESKKVKERYSQVIGTPMGLSARRSTEQARHQKTINAELRRSSSAPPTVVPSTVSTNPKVTSSKKKRARTEIVVNGDGEVESGDELHLLNRSIQERETQRQSAKNEELRVRILRKFEELLKNNVEDEAGLRDQFQQLLHNVLSHIPKASKLREVVPSIRLECIVKFVKDLVRGLDAGGQSVEEAINLSLVEIDSLLENGSTSSMDIDIDPTPSQIASPQPAPQPSIVKRLYQDILQLQRTMTNLDAFRLGIQQSLEQWSKENEQFAAEMRQLQEYVKSKGCEVVNVPGDGSCLYHAICLALLYFKVPDAPANHEILRKELVKWMEDQDEAWFELKAGDTKKSYLDGQLGLHSLSPEWGDINTIKAASVKYVRVFNVYSVSQGIQKVDLRGNPRGRKPAEIELLLVSFKHYMWGCPSNHVQRIAEIENPSTD